MHKLLVTLLGVLLLGATSAAKAETVKASIAIDGRNDAIVKDEARKKAIWKAALHYPALVSGVEEIDSTGKFSSEITALTAGAVELDTIREEWDRANNQYTLVAKASVNQSVSIEMIQGVQANLELQKRLKRVYQDLDKAVSSSSAMIKEFEQSMDDIKLVSSVNYRRDSYKESLVAREAMEKHFRSTVLRKVIQPLYDEVTFKLYDFDQDRVLFTSNIDSVGSAIDWSEFGSNCSVYVSPYLHSIFKISMNNCTLHPWYKDTPFERDMTLPYRFKTSGTYKKEMGERVLKFSRKHSPWGNKSHRDLIEAPELVYDNFAIEL